MATENMPSRGVKPAANPTIVASRRRERVWTPLAIKSADKYFLTSPRSRSCERVRRIIATIKLKEPSSNLYGICAGCHPLMLSARLGAPS
ncbi:unnamed protein product, partial [Iphiclides podalirius]